MKYWLLLLLLMFTAPAYPKIRINKSELSIVSESSLLIIQGTNFSNSDVILVIRADDSQDPGYADRANIERVIPKGKFELQVSFASLRTPSGRQLKLDTLEQIILFPGEITPGFTLISVQVKIPEPLGKNVYAWDLGPAESAIWPGFKPLTINMGLLSGKNMTPVDRSAKMQAADSLTCDGIRGIETASLPLPIGNWQITLWLRDAGEWEYLPHPLKRKIYANGKRIYVKDLTPSEWIQRIYLGRRDIEATPASSSWELFGKRESDRVTFDIYSDGTPIILRLYGDSTDAQFISAILAIPSKNALILDILTRQRKAWWEKNWAIANWKKWPTGQPSLTIENAKLQAAPGTSVTAIFEFEQGNLPGAPMIMLSQPTLNNHSIPAHWHWSQWQLTRTHLASTLLEAHDTYLRHGLMPANKGVAMPRQLVVRFDLPQGLAKGLYKGEMRIMIPGKNFTLPFHINVVDAVLPELTKPIGIYLEKPVHFGWFKELEMLGDQAMICDLRFLRKLGLTGISPPYPTPSDDEKRIKFNRLSGELNKLGFVDSMAYTSAKRLSQRLGAGNAANIVAEIEAEYKQKLQNMPYWSIADEPSNPGNTDLFKSIHRYFTLFAPTAKLAGHLNHSADKAYLPMFDMILINDGYGANKKDIQDAQDQNLKVWLYNMPNPRAAAGFYLWQTQADGFIQWHGRMPTADPFDPTDGREFDVQFLYPSENPCPQEPDINILLYDIMNGIVDHRWMLWLQQKANSNSNAKVLLNQLRHEIPSTWNAMRDIDDSLLSQWRQQIINLVD
ncbi:hypothetical protein [Candidatus Enterovibrio altilux]|uniref:Glycoside hydrolase 123 C-terminal domain-containing protein n=1 Tax=Candidatus Enterovibrio altilux TaxID=1927128 RepID=A0A291B8W8_9GAMM|nr:hypothetical protein [Candidatus Enterovibrio luxaltus]ATF09431.1 hypothetical protein BTN50_0924 [Candidatus Enterovibrio luxaltus]